MRNGKVVKYSSIEDDNKTKIDQMKARRQYA